MSLVAQTYKYTFLYPADPLRYATEPVIFPRTKTATYPKNTNEAILRRGTWMGPFWIPVKRFHNNNYRFARMNLLRSYGDSKHEWFFVRYHYSELLNGFAIDFDRHHKPNETKEEYEAIEKLFWRRCRDMESLGIPGDWTTTPGCVIGDVHHFGLNYNINFSAEKSVLELRKHVEQLRSALQWESIETNIDKMGDYTRNYRPPGQAFVQLANVDFDNETVTMRTSNFAEFLQNWQPVYNEYELFEEIVNDQSRASEMVCSQKTIPTIVGGNAGERGRSDVGSDSHGDDEHVNSQVIQKPNSNSKSVSKTIDLDRSPEENAFNRAWSVVSPVVKKFNWDISRLDEMKSAAVPLFTECSLPKFVDHVNNPPRLDKLLDRVFRHAIKTKDPSKCIPAERLDKDRLDAIRFAPSKKIGLNRILKRIKSFVSEKEIDIFSKFWQLAVHWDGRVAALSIYTWMDSKGICSCKEWKALFSKLLAHNILFISAAFDSAKKICRQFCLTLAFTNDDKDRQARYANTPAPLWYKDREEKKKKQYMLTLTQPDPFPALEKMIMQVAEAVETGFPQNEDECRQNALN